MIDAVTIASVHVDAGEPSPAVVEKVRGEVRAFLLGGGAFTWSEWCGLADWTKRIATEEKARHAAHSAEAATGGSEGLLGPMALSGILASAADEASALGGESWRT